MAAVPAAPTLRPETVRSPTATAAIISPPEPSPTPAAALPLFQGAAANLNPWTEAKVDTENPGRGPMLLISGEKDHTVPPAVTNASYKRQQRNKNVTEIVEIKGRGHALTIDDGWQEVAETALAFIKRFDNAQVSR